MDTQAELALRGDEVGEQPLHFLHHVRRGRRDHLGEFRVDDFCNFGNGRVANFPFHRCLLLLISSGTGRWPVLFFPVYAQGVSTSPLRSWWAMTICCTSLEPSYTRATRRSRQMRSIMYSARM